MSDHYGSCSSSSSSSGNFGSGSDSGMGTFLEELEARGVGVEEFHTNDAESRVISALSDGSQKDIAGIMCDSGCIPLGQLLSTVERLIRFGLIERRGVENDQKFSVSIGGKRAAEMMGVWRGKSA